MMGMIFAYPDKTATAARMALYVFGHDIVPVLFPYMVLTRILVSKTKEAGNSSYWFLIPIGWLGGSPSGASMIRSFYSNQSIPRRTLLLLCAITGTISPAFLLNTVGSWFQDSVVSASLVISHFAGAALTSALIFIRSSNDESIISPTSVSETKAEGNVIQACAASVLGIGGCLVFFSVLSEVISSLVFKSGGILTSLIHALLEISGGLKKLGDHLPERRMIAGILSSFACGFNGLSMLSQNILFLKEFEVTMVQLIAIGLLRAILSAVVMMILLLYSS